MMEGNIQLADKHGAEGTALLTGALGGVGEYILAELLASGYAVACFDLPTDANRKKARRLARSHSFAMHWGDLTSGADVQTLIRTVSPAVVVHAAAIIPPTSFKRPALAEAVNVGGTASLVAACEDAGGVNRFVLVSSYSVHGPARPSSDPPRWTGETPVDPQDDYARQKVEAERIVRASGLEHVIVRLCAVFPIEGGSLDDDMMRFSFMLPYDRREQAIDVRDAALAIARASVVEAVAGWTVNVGGGEGWDGIGGDMLNAMTGSMGLRPLPREAYRLPDPAIDASWYYENWVDAAPSQALLGYQRYSFADFSPSDGGGRGSRATSCRCSPDRSSASCSACRLGTGSRRRWIRARSWRRRPRCSAATPALDQAATSNRFGHTLDHGDRSSPHPGDRHD